MSIPVQFTLSVNKTYFQVKKEFHKQLSFFYKFLNTEFVIGVYSDRMRPNVYLAVEITSGFLRVRHAGSTIYSKRRLGPDQTHLVSIIIGSQVIKHDVYDDKKLTFLALFRTCSNCMWTRKNLLLKILVQCPMNSRRLSPKRISVAYQLILPIMLRARVTLSLLIGKTKLQNSSSDIV